jgi:hypothetical protein
MWGKLNLAGGRGRKGGFPWFGWDGEGDGMGRMREWEWEGIDVDIKVGADVDMYVWDMYIQYAQR